MNGKATCPTCKRRFKSLGAHWQNNPSHRVGIDKKKMDILTGVLMGDGWVEKLDGCNPRIGVEMVNREYLEYLDGMLGWLTTGVKHHETAKEASDHSRETGFNEDAKAENYHDIYRLGTIYHPDIEPLYHWYSSGEKKFPGNLTLNRTILKHWYVCDGSIVWGNVGNARAKITAKNESDRAGYLLSLFDEMGLEATWDGHGSVRFSTTVTSKLLQYMGEPVPGFEYKWENKRRNVYNGLKEEAYEQEYESPQTDIQDWV